LLGGAVLQANDLVIDGSVSDSLTQLALQIAG
jgi:F0F1-type ATP synthase delta subunit